MNTEYVLSQKNNSDTIPAANALHQMLEVKDYDQLDKLLNQFQSTIASREVFPILYDILLVARQMCSASDGLRRAAEWHRSALDQAAHQEEEIVSLLRNIIELLHSDAVWGKDWSAVASSGPGLSKNGSESLLHHLQKLLLGHIRSLNAPAPVLQKTNQPPAQQKAIVQKDSKPQETSSVHSLVIYGLGQFRVYRNGHLINDWGNRKSKSLFKYLLWNRQRQVGKEQLMELFWPEALAEAARNNLNVTIYNLRRTLRGSEDTGSFIVFKDDSYQLHTDLRVWADFEAFENYYRQGQRLVKNGQTSQAVRVYQEGEPLYQGDLFEEDRYDDWLIPFRQTIRSQYIDILHWLSQHALDNEDYAACVRYCGKLLMVDTCNEDAHRRLMQCYIVRGQQYLAMRQYFQCVEQLKDQLDVAPSPKTVALYEQIRANI